MKQTFQELLSSNMGHARRYNNSFELLQQSQHPDVLTVCCGDSRVLQDDMWNNRDPGKIFTHSNIGNRVVEETASGRAVTGDALYPLVHTGTETAIIVGHTGCGAVTATYDQMAGWIDEPAGIGYCIDILESGLREGFEQLPADLDREASINYLVEYNVDQQVKFLRESADVPDAVDICGVVYDFQDIYGGRRGEVHVINVNGERGVTTLKENNPEIDDRIRRLWEY